MAVKNVTQPEQATPAAPETPRTIDLELVVYKRYNLGNVVYEAEKAYRFTEEQGLKLLEEVEETTGRPVWRRYRPKPVAQRPDSGIKTVIDASANKVDTYVDPDRDVSGRRLEIGDDSEISDIINPDQTHDNITV